MSGTDVISQMETISSSIANYLTVAAGGKIFSNMEDFTEVRIRDESPDPKFSVKFNFSIFNVGFDCGHKISSFLY